MSFDEPARDLALPAAEIKVGDVIVGVGESVFEEPHVFGYGIEVFGKDNVTAVVPKEAKDGDDVDLGLVHVLVERIGSLSRREPASVRSRSLPPLRRYMDLDIHN